MNAPGYPLNKEDYHKCTKLVESIEADPGCDPFLMPVQWEELGLLDYPSIIKRPMDFDTLKKNLLAGKFATYEEFFQDLQLIWDNCKHYNMAGSDIYKLCERMEKMSKREMQKFKSAHGLNGLVLPTSAPKPAAPARSSKRGGAAAPSKPAANEDRNVEMEDQRESAEFDSNEVSRDMKLDFVNKIKKLSNQGLTSVVEKIKEIKSNTISDLGNDKIQIRVDDFARNEFDTLMEHVEDLLVKELPSKRQKTH